MYERRQYEDMDLSGKPALTIEDGVIEDREVEKKVFPDSGIFAPQNTLRPGFQTHIPPMAGDPGSRLIRCAKLHQVREHKESCDDKVSGDEALIEFIGEKNYNYIFENPV